MITLDEVIAHEKRILKDNKVHNFENIINYHKRIVEWLEELKMYKEVGTVEGYKSAIECYNEEYTMRKSNKQYNKAIDDFIKFANTMPTVEEEDGTIRPMWLEEIAEKLKEREVE